MYFQDIVAQHGLSLGLAFLAACDFPGQMVYISGIFTFLVFLA
jgi:hypothetical protein